MRNSRVLAVALALSGALASLSRGAGPTPPARIPGEGRAALSAPVIPPFVPPTLSVGYLATLSRDGAAHLAAYAIDRRAGFLPDAGHALWDVRTNARGAPVLLARPNDLGYYARDVLGYGAFARREARRRNVLFARGEDGALRAFDAGAGARGDAGTGAELFAFAPRDSSARKDAPPGAAPPAGSFGDVYLDTPDAGGEPCPEESATGDRRGRSCQWRTLFSGTGRGSVFALDVTRPDSMPSERRSGRPDCLADSRVPPAPGCSGPWPAVRWETSDPGMARSVPAPAFGRVRVRDAATGRITHRFVLFVGGGWEVGAGGRADRKGSWLYALDAATGRVLWKTDRGLVREEGAVRAERRLFGPIAAPPSAVDFDGDGTLDAVYFGDVLGQLWKLPLAASAANGSFDPGRTVLLFDGTLDVAGKRARTAPTSGGPFSGCPPENGIFFPPAVFVAGHDARTSGAVRAVAWGTGEPDEGATERPAGRIVVLFEETRGPQTRAVPAVRSLRAAGVANPLARIADPSAPELGACGREGGLRSGGWTLELLRGERPASEILAHAGYLYVTTATPGPDGVVSGGFPSPAKGRFYRLDARNGDSCRGAACCAAEGERWSAPGSGVDRGGGFAGEAGGPTAPFAYVDASGGTRVGALVNGGSDGFRLFERHVEGRVRLRNWREQ